jgi:nucleoside-diphosphate-sugar epimerase
VSSVTRANYEQAAGVVSDVTIDCAGNSKKYLADTDPLEDFRQSAEHRLRTLLDFPARIQLHISSVDVYDRLDSPETTHEDALISLPHASRYGFHKRLAEQIVQHHAGAWLILRLAGMIGSGLRKNPIHDILRGLPLRIHPDSRYQFMDTGDVARIAWDLVERGLRGEIVNVCGEGLVSPREVSEWAGLDLDLSGLRGDERPRVVNVSLDKLRGLGYSIPDTRETVRRFVMEHPRGAGLGLA